MRQCLVMLVERMGSLPGRVSPHTGPDSVQYLAQDKVALKL